MLTFNDVVQQCNAMLLWLMCAFIMFYLFFFKFLFFSFLYGVSTKVLVSGDTLETLDTLEIHSFSEKKKRLKVIVAIFVE